MATYARTVRRGLPRTPGGEPWPPAGDAAAPGSVGGASHVGVAPIDAAPFDLSPGGAAPAEDAAAEDAAAEDAVAEDAVAEAAAAEAAAAEATLAEATQSVALPPSRRPEASPRNPARTVSVRRGLPREPGGEAWPPPVPVSTASTDAGASSLGDVPARGAASPAPASAGPTPASAGPTPASAGPTPAPAGPAPAPAGPPSAPEDLPASSGATRVDEPAPHPGGDSGREAEPTGPEPAPPVPSQTSAPAVPPASAPAGAPVVRAPLEERRLAHAGIARRPAPQPEPTRIGPFTRLQWAGIIVVAGGGLLYAAAMAVLAVRWLLSLDPLQDFVTSYPGEYHLPDGAPLGFPAWLNWTHFLNAFFMVLIIRTGLQVRGEKRPSVFWISKKNRKRKMSLTLWLHQALDVLWLVNGAAFVILLFATGQWVRIVPTSWEVFPNALSAALQYVSLDWPTENGWVNYNALQQLAYFTTVFVAAPIAALTGYRMSAVWPKKATKLNELYPVEWARKLHFPTMLYFVAFIIVHVALVLSTGALRNLNHMYAAQGSVDPDAYAANWTGFWIFAASTAVIVGAYIAARPLVVAPIARLFGNVSGR